MTRTFASADKNVCMKAIVQRQYGPPSILELQEVDQPTVDGDDRVLIKVRAAAVNPVDWHDMTGTPYIARLQTALRKPKRATIGTDVAGTVEAVGTKVTRVQPGDEVFGGALGSLAEYATAAEDKVASKPANLTFEQAASVPIAALTALQALRDKGKLHSGQTVLINGAAGGVGTFAVQIAKALGAEVTGVCSTANVDMVTSLGADHVVDYTKDDVAAGTARFDVMLDNVGNRTLSDCRRVLQPKGIYVIVGGPKKGRLLGPAGRMVKALVVFLFAGQKAAPMLAKINHDDLAALADMLASGTITPVIDRTYPLADTADALRHLEGGHTKGKLVVTI